MILDTSEVHINWWIYLWTMELSFELFFSSFFTDQNLTPIFNKKSVTVMWRKYHVMMVYFLSQLQRWMVMIRSARECWRSSSSNQFAHEIVSPLPCSSELVRHTLLFVYFFQKTYFFHWLPWQMPHPALSTLWFLHCDYNLKVRIRTASLQFTSHFRFFVAYYF